MYLMPWDTFASFRQVETSYNLTGAAMVEVAKQDPTRVVLIFSCSANPTGYRITSKSGGIKGDGLWVADGLAPIIFSNITHGALTQFAWQADTSGGPAVMTVVELFLMRNPCNERRQDSNQLQS